MTRRTPLTPIFDPDIRRGGISVGNTPGTVVPEPDLVLTTDTTLSTGTDFSVYLESPNSLTIDWGDGNTEPAVSTGAYTHTYASEGTYTVRISADSPGGTDLGRVSVSGGDTGDFLSARKLVAVESWGDLGVTSLAWFADDASSLTSVPLNVPSTVTNMYRMFAGADVFNADIGGWDVSNVTTMDGMFDDADIFDQDISGWDVSSVVNMDYMFLNAAAFNQDLSGWCVSLIPSTPSDFDTGASSWMLPRPVWGTCP